MRRIIVLGMLRIFAGAPIDPITPGPAGFLLERLSPSQMRIWREIERIVFAEDCQGTPLHPKLRQLWCAIAASGHAVYVEMPRSRGDLDRRAGRFEVLERDPAGKRHVGLIRVSLALIEKASTGPLARRSDGFIPYVGLGKNERIAEALGHEIAHAACVFGDPACLATYDELECEVAEHQRYRREFGPTRRDEAAQRPLERIGELTRRIEALPEAAEVEVWQELHASCGVSCRHAAPPELRCR
jgi:hypothetical protein